MERKGDHALLAGEVDADHAVVPRDLSGLELLEGLGTAMGLVVSLNSLIGDPDGAEAGGLGGHHIDSVTEVNRELLDARAGELKDLILDETALECGLDKGYGHIMRADTMLRFAFKPHKNDLGSVDVPSVMEKLLDKLTATFADTHAAQ